MSDWHYTGTTVHHLGMGGHGSGANDDVRMRGFAHRHTVDAALAWLDAQLRPPGAELVPLRMAAGRVLAAAVVSDVDVPGFDRATMDGYAVIAESTEGATAYNRLPLTVIGDSLPGHPFEGSVARRPGRSNHDRRSAAARLRRRAARRMDRRRRPAHAAVDQRPCRRSPGKNVGRRGEDIVRGTTLFQPGRVLRPQDLGVLSSVGVGDVSRVQPAAGPVGGDRQRTAAIRFAAAAAIESSTPTDRCSPPSSSATAVSSTSLVWCLTNPMRS